jgi:hypothetical protein
MFEKLRSMFRAKESPNDTKNRDDLLRYMKTLSDDDWNVVTLLSGYWWKFGKETPDLAFIRAIQTLQYLSGSDPTLQASAARSMKLAYQWFQHWGPQARAWGEECVRLSVDGRDVKAVSKERTPATNPKQPYVDGIRKYGLQKEDMQALATISAFAWKYVNMPPKRAVAYAMQTIHMSRHGSPQERKDADTTWQSAVKWSVDGGPGAIAAGIACVEMVRPPSARADLHRSRRACPGTRGTR